MKCWIGTAAGALLMFLGTACNNQTPVDKATDGQPQSQAPTGVSFEPPANWQSRSVPGSKFKVAFGPPNAGFAPNINVVDESFSGSLAVYVDGNLAQMRPFLKKFHQLKQDDFQTTEGLAGVRVIVEDEQNGRMLRQTFYFFGHGDTKFVVTCTALAAGGDRLDQVFEASMKTFRFIRK